MEPNRTPEAVRPQEPEVALAGEATPAPEAAEAPQRPWAPWAMGFALLLLGFLAGWVPGFFLPMERLGTPPAPTGPPPSAGEPRAEVRSAGVVQAAAGEPVLLTWRVTNTGTATWTPLQYRFEPEGEGPVLPLRLPLITERDVRRQQEVLVPVRAAPGVDLQVEVTLVAPDLPGLHTYAWNLVGPRGAVPGGRLTATLSVGPPPP